MEIDKIVFGLLINTSNIDKSFEDLDINNDGKINNEDENLANNLEIKNTISQILASDIDEEDIILLDSEKNGNAKKSLEEFKKSVQEWGWAAQNADKLVNDKGYNSGTTFVVYNTVGVSTAHCGQLAALAEIFNNNFSNILETMYELSDQANFIYQRTQTWGRGLCSLDIGRSKDHKACPCIIKYVDGVAKDIIWLDDKENCSTEGFRNIITSNIEGYKENNSNVSNQENNNQDITDATTVNSKNDITELTKEYEILQAEKELLQNKYEQENAKLEEAQHLLDTYAKEYDNYQEEIEEINNKILKEQNRQQVAQQEQMDSIINDAINSYDKEKDGDFDAYLQKAMDTKGYPIYSCLSSLTDNANILSNRAKNVLNNILIQSNIVASLKLSSKSLSIELNGINSQLKLINDNITINTNNAINTNNVNDNIFATDNTSPTVKKETINSDNIDWSALKVEGKGINIYNLFKLFQNEKNPNSNRPMNFGSASDFLAKYNALSDEEKSVIDIFYDKEETKGNNIGRQNRSRLELLFQYNFNEMTRWDRDGDGFLSDDDIQEIKILADNGSNKNWNVPINDRAFEFCNMAIDAHSTTINGKKVYMAGNCVITEDEIDVFKTALNSSGNVDGANAMIKVMQELGGKTEVIKNGPCECCPNGFTSYGFEYTNSAGIKSYLATHHHMSDLNRQVKNILALAEKEKGNV